MSAHTQPLPFNLPAVSAFERPSTADFDQLKQEGRPFVMKGCLDKWPLYHELRTLSSMREKVAYLREHAANEWISFVVLPSEIEGHLYFANGLNTSGQKLQRSGSFAEFTEQLRNGAKTHLLQLSRDKSTLPLVGINKGVVCHMKMVWKPRVWRSHQESVADAWVVCDGQLYC